jgi:hypothetical protein
MPVHPSIATTGISQEDFKSLASEVMRHVFDIHNEYGRLFAEPVYKRELAAHLPEVILEAPVTVAHGNFTKTYFLDALVRNSGLRFDPLERQDPVPFVEGVIPEDAYRHGSHAGFVEVGGV